MKLVVIYTSRDGLPYPVTWQKRSPAEKLRFAILAFYTQRTAVVN